MGFVDGYTSFLLGLLGKQTPHGWTSLLIGNLHVNIQYENSLHSLHSRVHPVQLILSLSLVPVLRSFSVLRCCKREGRNCFTFGDRTFFVSTAIAYSILRAEDFSTRLYSIFKIPFFVV